MPEHCVPFWNYFIIKFQYYILYTLAGIYKLSPEWLSGYSMSQLNYHWVFTPFRVILGSTWTDLLIIHWFGCIFDLTIAFWLTHKRTRVMSTVFAITFHLMNSRLFTIGMFPWVCLGHLPLFYSVDWPRKLMATGGGAGPEKNLSVDVECQSTRMEIKFGHKRTTLLLGVYIFLQLFLPNSHFITRGYNNWTKGRKPNSNQFDHSNHFIQFNPRRRRHFNFNKSETLFIMSSFTLFHFPPRRPLWLLVEHDGELVAAHSHLHPYRGQ